MEAVTTIPTMTTTPARIRSIRLLVRSVGLAAKRAEESPGAPTSGGLSNCAGEARGNCRTAPTKR
jgi:hypothetical protein